MHYLEEKEGGEDDAKKTWNEIFWCGHWNGVPVNKIFIEQNTVEPKVKAYVPTYEPLEVIKCKKCGKL